MLSGVCDDVLDGTDVEGVQSRCGDLVPVPGSGGGQCGVAFHPISTIGSLPR